MNRPVASQGRQDSTPPCLSISWRSAGGMLILLITCMPLTVWRSSLEANLGVDEVYSLVFASHPVAQIVELTAVDAHPPGYYLLLKSRGYAIA